MVMQGLHCSWHRKMQCAASSPQPYVTAPFPLCSQRTWEHGGSTRQHDVGVQVLTDVHVALHDGVEGGVVDAVGLHAHHAGVEQHLRAAEALVANGDDLAGSIRWRR